jgi:rubrerythrin
MPDFATAFTVKASDRILTHNELVRAIRLMVADEYEAIQVYTQLAESIDNPLAKAVLLDIANEEKVHAGEFLHLLSILAPDEKGYYNDGVTEVEAQVAALGGRSSAKAGQGETTIGSMKE